MTELQGVLFDMDGTLCDTEPLWAAAEASIAAEFDAAWTDEDGMSLVGFDLLHAGAVMVERMGLPLSPEQVVARMVSHVAAGVRRLGTSWMPGATDLVTECNERGIPVGLATMSYRVIAESVVAAMPTGRFDAVVTGDQVANGKPAPDAYLRAAELLDVEPAACVAIEDSPSGAASAEAAGCLVLVVPNHVDVPLTSRRRHSPSLQEVTLDDLARVLTER
ncbi:MAG: HAD family hydrolase [Nocardioidaceae bacterium]